MKLILIIREKLIEVFLIISVSLRDILSRPFKLYEPKDFKFKNPL